MAVAIVVVVLLGGVLVAGYTLASSSAQAASYTCGSQLTPATPASGSASASPSLGQTAPDQGRIHIPVSTTPQFYASCPPASGPHYNTPDAPIPGGFYGPDQNYGPQYWIHNLEHGQMAILYRCDGGTCDQSAQQTLRSYLATPPNSPICAIPNWMVAVRFDQMPAPFAAVTWDHVLFQQKLDTGQITQFFDQAADRGPEAQCAAAPGTQSPQPSGSVSGSAGASTSAAPSIGPSGSSSAGSSASAGASPSASTAP